MQEILLLLIAETVVRRHQAGAAFVAVASAIWCGAIILSVVFLVPINNRLAHFGANSVAEVAREQHRRWDRLHRYRVAALTTSMLCFLIAL